MTGKQKDIFWTAQQFLKLSLMCLLLFPIFISHSFAQNVTKVPVHIGRHGDHSRIVFDFSKLTGYTVKASGNKIDIVFNTSSALNIPGTKTQQIKSIQQDNSRAGTVKLTLDTAAGTSFKHYRMQRKIILEIFDPGADKTPDKKTTPQEVKSEPAPLKEKETPTQKTAIAAPAPATTPETKPETPHEETAATQAEPSKPETAEAPAPAEEQTPPAELTKVVVPTLSPTKLAVFSRFNTLWLVLDTETPGAVSPSVSGPDAGLLGNPKPLRVKGGTAYRYTIPPKKFLNVKKENLSWIVSLSDTRAQPPANNRVDVQFDDSSGKAKLMAELKDGSSVLEIQDPVVGDTLFVVASGSDSERIDRGRRFSDVEVLPAALGVVVRPLKDGIKTVNVENYVLISSTDGIIATPGAMGGPALVESDAEDIQVSETESRLFDFPNWRRGGARRLVENQRMLEYKIAASKTPEERTDNLMQLALLFFTNNFGQETLGVLRIIEQENEEIVNNANFMALRGAANALAGHYRDALQDLSYPAIQQHAEVNLWKGYAAAASEEWTMANRSFPKDNRLLISYPDNIAIPFTIYMAESALRLGKIDSANALLNSLNSLSQGYDPHYLAAISYLKGEAARQEGDIETAINLWSPVANGLDRLYHTKASLALANLELHEKKISLKDAVDRVDSLRFAWRGNGLEIQILQNLGLLKTQNQDYLSGLRDLKTAAELNEALQNDSQQIRDDMNKIVSDLFTGPDADKLKPLDALSIYGEFGHLLPEGSAGTAAKLNFTEYLIRMDLLDEAANLLAEQLKNSTTPPEKMDDIVKRLTAVYLLNNKPQQALDTLQVAATGLSDQQQQERALLKARAQSQLNMTDDAIVTLSAVNSPDAARLKADVLWRAHQWDKAALAIQALLPLPPPSTQKLGEEEAKLVLNVAVALKLSNNPGALRELKSKWNTAMSTTSLGSTFGVVTREGGSTILSDRDTILKIAGEVDMFKGFLDSYKAAAKGS